MSAKRVLLVGLVLMLAGCSRDAIRVERVFPEPDSSGVASSSYIVVVLDGVLPDDSGPGLLETDPLMPGRLTVEGNKLIFEPSQLWEPGTTYTVSYIHPSVKRTTWRFTAGEKDTVDPGEEPKGVSLGSFTQVMSVTWTPDGCLLGILREEGNEALVRFGPQGDQEVLFETDPYMFYLAEPLAEGLGVVYSNLESYKIWHVRPGSSPETVAPGLIFKVSPDRKKAVIRENNGFSIIVDFETGASRRLPALSSREYLEVDWSPEGNYLACQVLENHHFAIEILHAGDCSSVMRVSLPGAHCVFPEWSPLGRSVAFLVADEGTSLGERADMAELPVGQRLGIATLGGHVSYYNMEEGVVMGAPVWSLDGNRIAFAGGDPEDVTDGFLPNSHVYVLEMGKDAQKVEAGLPKGYARPLSFSPDGERLFLSVYVSRGAEARDIAYITSCSEGPLVKIGEIGGGLWVDDTHLAVWFMEHQQGSDIWLVDAWGGLVESLSAGGWRSHGMALSPDGASLAYISYNPENEDREYIMIKDFR